MKNPHPFPPVLIEYRDAIVSGLLKIGLTEEQIARPSRGWRLPAGSTQSERSLVESKNHLLQINFIERAWKAGRYTDAATYIFNFGGEFTDAGNRLMAQWGAARTNRIRREKTERFVAKAMEMLERSPRPWLIRKKEAWDFARDNLPETGWIGYPAFCRRFRGFSAPA
jgi:hypothetical protein